MMNECMRTKWWSDLLRLVPFVAHKLYGIDCTERTVFCVLLLAAAAAAVVAVGVSLY